MPSYSTNAGVIVLVLNRSGMVPTYPCNSLCIHALGVFHYPKISDRKTTAWVTLSIPSLKNTCTLFSHLFIGLVQRPYRCSASFALLVAIFSIRRHRHPIVNTAGLNN